MKLATRSRLLVGVSGLALALVCGSALRPQDAPVKSDTAWRKSNLESFVHPPSGRMTALSFTRAEFTYSFSSEDAWNLVWYSGCGSGRGGTNSIARPVSRLKAASPPKPNWRGERWGLAPLSILRRSHHPNRRCQTPRHSAEGQHNPRSDAERLADVETHLARAVGPHLTSGSKTRLQRTDDGPRRLDLIGQNGSDEPDR